MSGTAIGRVCDGSTRRLGPPLAAALGLAVLVVLLSAPRAEAVPIVTYKCTPAPQDCSGWYRSPVSIDWTVLPSDATIIGCQDKTYTTDTAGTNELCSADDGAATVTVQLKIRVDQTPPETIAGTPSRAADVNGWYNHPLGITFSGTDQTSAIDSCTSLTYSGPDSGAASVAGTCRDKAGNVSAPFPYGLKYDATGSTVTGATPDRLSDVNGWYDHPVGFDFGATDATSGVAACTPVTYQGPDDVAATVHAACRDRAGNSSSRQFALKYDATPPTATTATPERNPNDAGWYNRPIQVTFGGTDQTSGVDVCTAKSYDGPDSATASMPGTCTDKAGNRSNPLAFNLKYDATAPQATAAVPDRPPNDAGWYRRPVSVTFSGSDAASGVDACASPTYAGPDDAGASVSGSCTDRAGNRSNPLAFNLKYDATGPEVTAARAERAPDLGGWYLDPVRFDFTGTDATSGLAGCGSVLYSAPDGPNAEVIGECRDRADNVSQRAFPLKFDGNPPAISNLTASAGDRRLQLAWQTTADVESVEIVRTPGPGTDAGTLVFAGPGTSFTDERVENGVRYTYDVTVRDPAGNRASATVTGVPAAPPVAPPALIANVPTPRLLAPLPGAVIRMGRPPLFRWVAVKRARYYNIQLYRARRKVLSAWPSRRRYQLPRSWTFASKSRRLAPGKYRWMVWPGFGPRSRAEYGEQIGRSTFTVIR